MNKKDDYLELPKQIEELAENLKINDPETYNLLRPFFE